MVDFKKRLVKRSLEKPIDPFEIYEKLDRDSDKGPLRPAQNEVLSEWHKERRNEKDIILKLHTGQGKTLIGLLILQSKMNENEGTSIYLCPNNFLVRQTLIQAKQFGVNCVDAVDDLPEALLDGKAILVTSIHKVFNGLTKFGIGSNYIPITNVVMDDAHACIDAIKDSFIISLENDHEAYQQIVTLFGNDLEDQGVGTYADIIEKDYNAFLPVPYWAWYERRVEVAKILAKHSKSNEIKFAWPLLRDIIKDCICIVSGKKLEISPYNPPLHMFGSYSRAEHRVFMSATVTDDSFLIKGLGLSEAVVRNPLVYRKEKWSGEKMVLIPSFIHKTLTKSEIVSVFGKPNEKRKNGVVILCPSFSCAQEWKEKGAIVATKDDIHSHIDQLRSGQCSNSLVVANRYDGIDLPDSACRILIFDSKPFAEALIDRYIESCREGSEIIATKTARIIEQGLGRTVRGEKDYCVIILVDPGLIKCMRTKASRKYFSAQTRKQIEIGLEITEMVKEDISDGVAPIKALKSLITQALQRDEGWKEFYNEKMSEIDTTRTESKALKIFTTELEAEKKYEFDDFEGAVQEIQRLVDSNELSNFDKGWYLQEMARYICPRNKTESIKLQVAAHKKNRYLLKPKSGLVISKITTVSQKRIENISTWINSFESFEDLYLSLDELIDNLKFGVKSDLFEKSFDDLAKVLGFKGQRPDKEWKAGPDNLWALKDNDYLLVECKNEVLLTRNEIYKTETGQMNNAIAWFRHYYSGANVKNIMIIPTNVLSAAAGFNEEVEIMTPDRLRKLLIRVRSFFNELSSIDLKDISGSKIQNLIDIHELTVDDIKSKYSKKVRRVA